MSCRALDTEWAQALEYTSWKLFPHSWHIAHQNWASLTRAKYPKLRCGRCEVAGE